MDKKLISLNNINTNSRLNHGVTDTTATTVIVWYLLSCRCSFMCFYVHVYPAFTTDSKVSQKSKQAKLGQLSTY